MGTTILTGLNLMSQKEALSALETSLREGRALAHWTQKK
jgi:hypothetical protein